MSSSAAKRRHKHPEHEEHVNHERWLVSYADMLTVLVFFLLVYSTEQVTVVPDKKEVQLPQSISETQITNTVVVIVGAALGAATGLAIDAARRDDVVVFRAGGATTTSIRLMPVVTPRAHGIRVAIVF